MISVRLNSTYKNTITTPHVSGQLVFSLTSPHTLTRVSLCLAGTHDVRFVETFQSDDGHTLGSAPYTSHEQILTVSWPNLLVNSLGSPGHFSDTSSQMLNLLPISQFDHDIIRPGTTPFPNSPNNIYVLSPGNYAFPFEFTLPNTTPDSITTAQSAINYTFSASIHSTNIPPYTATKPVTILLRQPPSVLSTYTSENAWPGKIQYVISTENNIPLRPSSIPTVIISLTFIPIIKKLSLGRIKAHLCRHTSIHKKKFDKILHSTTLPCIPAHQLPLDNWKLKAVLPMHAHITANTSSPHMSITHKLVLVIDLINPDSHISQIKCKIPLNFYTDLTPATTRTPTSVAPELHLIAGIEPVNIPQPIQTPPSYFQSRNDTLYVPSTPTTTPPIPPRSQNTPDYSKVYDDALDAVGEPTPIYHESPALAMSLFRNAMGSSINSSGSLPTSRATSPLVRRGTQNLMLSRRVLSLNSNLNRLGDVHGLG